MEIYKFHQLKYFHRIALITFIACCVAQTEDEGFQMDSTEKMQAVKDKIFKDYDKSIRPTIDEFQEAFNITQVYITFIPMYINDVDEEKGLLIFDSMVWMSWLDVRLQWNDSFYNDHLQIPKDMLWVPDISVLNSLSSAVDATYDVPLQVYPYGYVYWIPKLKTITSCNSLTQTAYPNDILTCTIELGSWSIDGWTIKLNQGHQMYLEHFENIHQGWELLVSEIEMTNETWYFECCISPYVSLTYHLPLRRRPLPEIEATRIPCILIMILTLATYWLPNQHNMKYILNPLLFAVLSVLLVYVISSTRNPLGVLCGVSFLQSTMYIGIITVLLQVFIVLKVATWSTTSHPPIPVIEILTGRLGKYLLLRSPFSEDKVILDQMKLNEDFTTTERISIKEEWILLATALDRIFFSIMLIVTISVHHL